jgi:hypothetical protein
MWYIYRVSASRKDILLMPNFFDRRNYEAFCEHVEQITDLSTLKLAVIDLATYLRDAVGSGEECYVGCGHALQELTFQMQGMEARIELMRDIIDRLEAEGVLSRKAN